MAAGAVKNPQISGHLFTNIQKIHTTNIQKIHTPDQKIHTPGKKIPTPEKIFTFLKKAFRPCRPFVTNSREWQIIAILFTIFEA